MHFCRTRPTRPTCLEAALVLGLWAWGGAAWGVSRVGDADARLQDGQPCFTITASEAARGPAVRVQAVSVADPFIKPVTDLWWVMFDAAQPPPISPDRCVVYGQAGEGTKGIPAPALQTRKVYEVFINGRPSDASDPTRGYRGRFCLTVDASGARQVMAVAYGTRAWSAGVCD